jgi:hypothetical protein
MDRQRDFTDTGTLSSPFDFFKKRFRTSSEDRSSYINFYKEQTCSVMSHESEHKKQL